MFFSLEHYPNPRFPQQWILGELILNTDSGWHRKKSNGTVWIYKGYADHDRLDQLVSHIADDSVPGNFCVFQYRDGVITLHTNRYRGFMIWHDSQRVSNLVVSDHAIWNDQWLTIHQDLAVAHDAQDIIGEIDFTVLSRQQALDQLDEILDRKVKQFVQHNDLPLRVFLSGGVDSMLVFSYIKKHTDRYELIWENRIEWDEFWCQNRRTIQQQFWGYNQIHHWRDRCVLVSGTPGDEFMLRSPTTANLYLMYHGSDIPQLIAQGGMHAGYFQKHLSLFENQLCDPDIKSTLQMSKQDFFWYLCNTVLNDCQHWHLGNTLTFTPLRDLALFKLLLRLPFADAVAQIMHSEISLALIERNDPELLKYLSPIKNTGETFSNLVYLMNKHSAKSGQ